MILVNIYVKTFKTGIIVFICDFIICLTSHSLIIFNIRASSLILTILLGEIKGNTSKFPIKQIPYKQGQHKAWRIPRLIKALKVLRAELTYQTQM